MRCSEIRSAIERTVDVVDEAISVSGGYGTVFEPSGRYHHIFDPATGLSAARMRDDMFTQLLGDRTIVGG